MATHDVLHGIGVSAGTAAAPAAIVQPAPGVDTTEPGSVDAAADGARVREALAAVSARLSERATNAPEETKAILKATAQLAGDRGLAGGYNSNILKAIEADAEGADYCVLPIGKKAVEHFERRKAAILTTAFAEAGDLSVSDCFEISRLVCQKFLAGEFDEIRLGFTQFVSMLTQTATVLPVLPFDAQRPEPGHERESLMMYEPDGKTVFDAIIPEYLAGVVYGALCESVASEQGARRMAMDAATKNAGDMIDHLNLYYNRARQAAITQEITEIVAGADAES